MRLCFFSVLLSASPSKSSLLLLACPSLLSALLPELNIYTAVSLKARPLCQSRAPVFGSVQQSGLVFPVVFLAFSTSSCCHPESYVAALFFKWILLCVFITRDVPLILISVAVVLTAVSVQEKAAVAFYFF